MLLNKLQQILKNIHWIQFIVELISQNQQQNIWWGNYVRISKNEDFTKKFVPNRSKEVFLIRKIQLTNPRIFLLLDESNKNILGGVYTQQ